MSPKRPLGTATTCLALLFDLTLVPRSGRADVADTCIEATESAVAARKAGRLLESRTWLSTCANPSCPDAVRTSCEERLVELSQAIPSIVFVPKSAAGDDLPGVRLFVDGKLHSDRFDGTAITLDPGEHEFRFEAPAQEAVVRRMLLHEGERNRLEEVVIGTAPAIATKPPSTDLPPEVHVASAPLSRPPSTAPAGRATSAIRTTGIIATAAGGVGLGLGGLFGALSLGAHNAYEGQCGAHIGAPAGQCTAAGLNRHSDALSFGTASTALFIGGGLVTAVGAVLLVVAPTKSGDAHVAFGPNGVWVRGSF